MSHENAMSKKFFIWKQLYVIISDSQHPEDCTKVYAISPGSISPTGLLSAHTDEQAGFESKIQNKAKQQTWIRLVD